MKDLRLEIIVRAFIVMIVASERSKRSWIVTGNESPNILSTETNLAWNEAFDRHKENSRAN